MQWRNLSIEMFKHNFLKMVKFCNCSECFLQPTSQTCVRMKGTVLSIKSLNQTFFCFFWQKTIVVGKAHTVCQANNPTSIHSHTHFERATEKRSRPNLLKTRAAVSLLVHFIPISKNQSCNHILFPASTSYIFDIFEKNLPYRYSKSYTLQAKQTIDRLTQTFSKLN